MSELYLLRHAKAVPQGGDLRDADRPLEERGREGASAVADWLKRQELRPDLVLCSPSLRTRETLDLVGVAFRRPPEIRFENELYLAGAERLMARLREIPERIERVMVVGHNPGLHEFAQALTDVTNGPLAGRVATNLPTASLVRFEIAVEWAALRRRCARLVALVSPKDLIGRD